MNFLALGNPPVKLAVWALHWELQFPGEDAPVAREVSDPPALGFVWFYFLFPAGMFHPLIIEMILCAFR